MLNQFSRCAFESLESRQMLATNLVADYGGFYPTDAITIGEISFFTANDGVHGTELWRSDGTLTGTQLVADLAPGLADSWISSMTALGDRLLFFAAEGASDPVRLWASDGTPAGTQPIADISNSTFAPYFPRTTVGGKLIFAVVEGDGHEVWLCSSDGTAAGTRRIKLLLEQQSGGLTFDIFAIGNRAVFTLPEQDVWSSDGTESGTVRILAPDGRWDLDTSNTQLVGGTLLYFDYVTTEIWATDGTQAGTRLVKKLPHYATGFRVLGDRVLFEMNESGTRTLNVTDGTPAGTFKLVDVPGQPLGGLEVGDLYVFAVSLPGGTMQIWRTDGTAQNTGPITTLFNEYLYFTSSFVSIGDLVFFGTSRATPDGVTIWKLDLGTGQAEALQTFVTEQVRSVFDVNLEVADGKLAVVLLYPQPETRIFDPATMGAPVGPAQGTMRLDAGVLRIFGTRDADNIRIYRHSSDPSRFVVQLNDRRQSFAFADVRKLLVFGYSGDDAIAIYERLGLVSIRSRIWGGGGNDIIHGGSSRDTIHGDSGDDRIFTARNDDVAMGGDGDDSIDGGIRNDIISGEAGADTVIGSIGDDIVSGGFDGSTDNIDGGGGIDVIFGRAVFEIFFAGQQGEDPLDEVLVI